MNSIYDTNPGRPQVLIVVPCLNERDHIESVIECFYAEAEQIDAILIVADGGSTDGTLSIVRRYAEQRSRIKILANERRIQSSAVNRAVEAFGDRAAILIRVDAHARYPDQYCEKLIAVQAKTGAASVVVGMIAEGRSCFQKAVAAAQNSRLGNGGSPHRSRTEGQFVDHGHHALMMIEAYRLVGGYDESFSHNEDAELDVRLVAAKRSIYLADDPQITYFPRKDPVSLFLQYLNFGRGRAKNMLKHRSRPKPRQAIPIMVVPAIALAFFAPILPIMLVPAGLWLALCLGYGCLIGIRNRELCDGLSGVAAIIMHFGFSLGFLLGFAKGALFDRDSVTPQVSR
jgi:succinoglycan biosynthesis protein ExoA